MRFFFALGVLASLALGPAAAADNYVKRGAAVGLACGLFGIGEAVSGVLETVPAGTLLTVGTDYPPTGKLDRDFEKMRFGQFMGLTFLGSPLNVARGAIFDLIRMGYEWTFDDQVDTEFHDTKHAVSVLYVSTRAGIQVHFVDEDGLCRRQIEMWKEIAHQRPGGAPAEAGDVAEPKLYGWSSGGHKGGTADGPRAAPALARPL